MTAARVLLIDDDSALLEALPEVLRLRMPRVVVETCDTAPAALVRVAAVDYDAVVTDIKMPGMDGLALLSEVRTLRPETPTLLITGHGEHDLAVQALRGGAYDFIQKPIDRDYFVASLGRAIRTRQLARQVEWQEAALRRHASELERAVEARTRELREANLAKDDLLRRAQAARAEAEAAERRIGFLADASARLAQSLDYEATLARLTRLAVPALTDWCAVDMVGPDLSIHELAVAYADSSKADLSRRVGFRFLAGPEEGRGVQRVVQTGQPELIPEVRDEMLVAVARDPEQLRMLRALRVRSSMCVPLTARGRTLGALTFITAASGRRYGPADLSFAEDLGRRAGLAIDNARLYEEAQTAVRARDDFLARASHELRTPLTSAFGAIRLLKQAMGRNVAESPEALIGIASRNLETMGTLIEELLDASKLVAGRETLELEPTDVARAVAAALDVVAVQAREKAVRLRVAVPSGLGFLADRLRLEQLLVNLLANAVKFTPPGGEVVVETEVDGGDVVLRVRDTGEGIAREQLGSIFEPFVQATPAGSHGPARRRRPRGAGLGLAICRQIVELHGGVISADSEGPGRGSTFTVRMPVSPALRVKPSAA